MISIDANVVIAAVTEPVDDRGREMRSMAESLLEAIERGRESAAISEAIVSEIVFVLSSKRGFDAERSEVRRLIEPILTLPGLSVPARPTILNALQTWATTPALSFPDCLVLESCLVNDWKLATFDRALARTAGDRAFEFTQVSQDAAEP